MNKLFYKKAAIFIGFFLSMSLMYAQLSPASYVNPFVGTDENGHTFPGAIVPFGAVQLSPDTRLTGWQGCSGYHYSDTLLYGFSHTHLSGTGCSDYGDVLVMPFTGTPSVKNSQYAQPFYHQQENATAGYYSVWLDKIKVKAELTATQRIGVHRYSYPKEKIAKGIILDLQHRDKVLFSKIVYLKGENKILGIRNSEAWSTNQKLSFSMLFSNPITKVELYKDDQLVGDATEIEGTNCKAIIYFADKSKEVVIKVAISGIDDPVYADKNQAEWGDFNFEKIKKQAVQSWNEALGKIYVEGGTDEQKRTFYTALYHTFTSPYLFSNIDGSYMGMDGNIHQADKHNVFTVFSLWDTFRALHPLLNLIDRAHSQDFIYTFMRHYEQGGMLPVWELSAFETWCMIGYHSVPVIYDAYQKGLLDNYSQAEKEEILQAMVHSATLNKLGRPEYVRYGFIPADKEHEAVSKTVEYAFDDWCIAQFAKGIGDEAQYEEFIYRSQFYKNLLDDNGFMHPVINGGFMRPFNPTEINNHFTEGNSWQYSTFVPHDFTNYIRLLGGEEQVSQHLDSLFHTTAPTSGRDQADVTGLIGQYAHGNEPRHHAAYLYNYVGQPWKTQEMVRQIMSDLYSSKPDGLCGNEDCGQMSAWYVFSAMGFYPVCPGDNKYVLGSPIFDKMSVRLENGKTFTVICHNQSETNRYIENITLNGTPLTHSYITFEEINNGGTLEMTMSSKPNKQWANSAETSPKNEVNATLVPSPLVSPSTKAFADSLEVTISVNEKRLNNNSTPYVIYYTTDGTFPGMKSIKYEKPILLKENTSLQMVVYQPGYGKSRLAEARFIRVENDKNIQLFSRYNPQYSAGGAEGLLDGIRGNENWRIGNWQGYQSCDFEAVIDLRTLKDIQEVKAGFLQDTRSWIFFPKSMTVEISDDNITWHPYGIFINPYSEKDENITVKDFAITKQAKARYLRVKAANFGDMPEWHLSAGYPAFIFIDEIIIR
ncbi:MAG: GH92 family glycosyl hydrolase [Bacteroidales bacterium]|jgi:predicted alpha-1,2-mannosidase|nr:GH92 family glycosyl hydrolase [Bacteroidales bacterium]